MRRTWKKWKLTSICERAADGGAEGAQRARSLGNGVSLENSRVGEEQERRKDGKGPDKCINIQMGCITTEVWCGTRR